MIILTYDIRFQTLKSLRVELKGMILKTSMVRPGQGSGMAIDPDYEAS